MGEEQESIGGLFARLADDAGTLVRAEVELYRATALHRLALSRPAIILLVAAVLLAQAAVVCLLVMLAIGLSRWIGPVGSGIAVTLVALVLAALLARFGLHRLSQVAGEAPEESRP
jgi:Na+/H+ antiporter NhaA